MKKIHIYISTFGKKVLNQKYSIPIEVGASLRENFIYKNRDDVGDSISAENVYFGELTGLYWIWKNDHSNQYDIVGFFHYNKGLDINESDLKNLQSEEWIVLKKCKNNSHPLINEITATRDIIKDYYPSYLAAWDMAYRQDGSGDICNAAQLFVTTYKEFREYCEFLFGILFKLRGIIGEGDSSPYYKRYCAFIGERLLTVYLLSNNKPIIEKGMKYPNFLKTFLSRVLYFIDYDRNSSLYLLLQKKFGRKSSYTNNKGNVNEK